MQRQAREACVAVAAQTAAVRGTLHDHTCSKRSNSLHIDFDDIFNSHYSTILYKNVISYAAKHHYVLCYQILSSFCND